MKIVIFGIGFLGNKLMNFFSSKYEVIGADINTENQLVKKVDATSFTEVKDFLNSENPDIVIDTVALSSYFICEKHPELSEKLNFKTAKYIAEACRVINAKMIFISSSYVFDGKKGNYHETDSPNSSNTYARSKIKAEEKVLELDNSIVIRAETLYGFNEKNGQLTVGTNTFEVDTEVGYPDILRSPVFVDDVPRIIYSLIKKNQSGIFHIASQNKMKWLVFLEKLSSLVDAQNKIKIVDSSSWILKPPQDSSLNISKINSLGIFTTSFEDAFNELKKITSP